MKRLQLFNFSIKFLKLRDTFTHFIIFILLKIHMNNFLELDIFLISTNNNFKFLNKFYGLEFLLNN